MLFKYICKKRTVLCFCISTVTCISTLTPLPPLLPFFRLLSFHLLLPLVLAPAALAWTAPPTWAACQREKHTCSGFTCGGMADRHSRSLSESHLELKIALCLRREGSWKVYSEREIETSGLFLSHASVCGNPRRDFLVKTLLPFFKNQIYWSIFTCVRLPWCLNSSFSWTKNKIKALYCAASLVNTPTHLHFQTGTGSTFGIIYSTFPPNMLLARKGSKYEAAVCNFPVLLP